MMGGTIIDRDKKVTINNPNAIMALDIAKSWVGTIAPRAASPPTETKKPVTDFRILKLRLCAIGHMPTYLPVHHGAQSLENVLLRCSRKVERTAGIPRPWGDGS
jgi:hypothetical protein